MIGTAHMMPNEQQTVVLPSDNIKVLSNGSTLRSPNNFTGYHGNIQNANASQMINVNGQWIIVQNGVNIEPLVKLENLGHTGRHTPNNISDQIAMRDTMTRPFEHNKGSREVMRLTDSIGDGRWED